MCGNNGKGKTWRAGVDVGWRGRCLKSRWTWISIRTIMAVLTPTRQGASVLSRQRTGTEGVFFSWVHRLPASGVKVRLFRVQGW